MLEPTASSPKLQSPTHVTLRHVTLPTTTPTDDMLHNLPRIFTHFISPCLIRLQSLPVKCCRLLCSCCPPQPSQLFPACSQHEVHLTAVRHHCHGACLLYLQPNDYAYDDDDADYDDYDDDGDDDDGDDDDDDDYAYDDDDDDDDDAD
jgi:hypothetical protein